MKFTIPVLILFSLIIPIMAGEKKEKSYILNPVGTVLKNKGSATLKIKPEYRKALLGLEQYSHVFVMYWFDRNDTPEQRSILRVHPRANTDNPLTGVFACRAPVRPNLIALSLCRIRSVNDSTVVVDYIDAFDGTPVLDLKPYVPAIDAPGEKVRLPEWTGK